VFEKVIQEVCDASQVDFEESGVDQQTLHDLRDVSTIPFHISLCPPCSEVDSLGGRPKAGEAEEVREAVLMGDHRLMSSPLYMCRCYPLRRF
jgi:hypothetical protein